MRVVLDVNIWISALLWGGLPSQILHLSRQNKITIFVSESLLGELETTLKRTKFKNQLKKRNHTVEYLITGDQDLLVLDNFRGILIMKPTDFLNCYFLSERNNNG
ncbi:Nucleotide binding protein PINc [Planktothrix serta PCC 8927]|uniref:Nucleotide binding protein PINc n=1 Tax=Planktothrix serta PCC 8927 TaxID=671068 RepID=A0A7Z9BJU7_9CYAN|nr:putative toxin-antitoxin system toxin component, PIN family [Planktothrix serta]VXD15529.1 Nucleotide binding protein PINc [Planktothrix serta PCC 8927]